MGGLLNLFYWNVCLQQNSTSPTTDQLTDGRTDGCPTRAEVCNSVIIKWKDNIITNRRPSMEFNEFTSDFSGKNQRKSTFREFGR